MSIDGQFIIQLKGKSYPTWPGILDAATRAGLKSLTTTVIQIPDAGNGGMAVVTARAEFADGRIFEDVGDCSPASTSPQLAAAALRLASTRAKGRALRDALNVGQTMAEELPDEERSGGFVRVESAAGESALPANGHAAGCERCGQVLTKAQEALSANKWGRLLCPTHQREAVKG